MNTSVILLLLLYIISAIYAQDNCGSKEKCSECIREPGCVWCVTPRDNVHCKSKNVNKGQWCSLDKLIDPRNYSKILTDIELNPGKTGNAVQIKPQKIKLSIRRGEEMDIVFNYKKAANYPVDLYYIMDLSNSMKAHKRRLALLGDKLIEVMQKITTNFKLGFGSFVDKTTMPYMSIDPSRIDSPCGPGKDCVRGYSFINHLSLTNDYKQFGMKVKEARVSGNLDSPEGGFDALMQAIVCKEQIGWRPNARHMIIFSTDADYHVGGDGKLAGIFEPNDATCHMENDTYAKALDYDYPSVAYLNYIAKENNINMIFAVAKNIHKTYKELQEHFENSAVGSLEQDSSNVVTLVEDNYKKIVDSVRITDNATSSVEIKYNVSCSSPIENGCSKLTVGEIVTFTATIKPLECMKGSNSHIIHIKPEGVNETLIVNLEVLCDCDCEELKESNVHYIRNSTICNYHGDLVCGVCTCKDGHFGNTCECNNDSAGVMVNDTNCMKDPETKEICSGLGTCKCGMCMCEKRQGDDEIYGKYCECDNFSCIRVKNQVCSGPERGNCSCGECVCLRGWGGEACDCRDTITTCIKPGSKGEICSGRGTCKCGECQCNRDEFKYSGHYCEECASCSGQRCQEFQPCVECQAYQSGVYDKDACQANCTEFNTTVVEKIDEESEDESIKICRVIDSNGCTIKFQYIYGDEQMISVTAEKTITCPEPINIMAVIWGVIAAVVLGGLILLIIWKIVTNVHDGREYAKFLESTQGSKWAPGNNPVYKAANTTYNNPAYKQ